MVYPRTEPRFTRAPNRRLPAHRTKPLFTRAPRRTAVYLHLHQTTVYPHLTVVYLGTAPNRGFPGNRTAHHTKPRFAYILHSGFLAFALTPTQLKSSWDN